MNTTKKIKASMIDSFMWEITKDQPNYNAFALMELDAPLDENRFKVALEKLIMIVPVVVSKPFFGFFRGYWEFREDFDASEILTSIKADSLSELPDIIDRLRSNPANMAEGPYIHVYLINGPGKYYYAFQAHHLVTDGAGIIYMMKKLAECYRKLEHEPEWAPGGSPSTERGTWQIGKQLSFKQYMAGMKLNRENNKKQSGTVVLGDYKGSADNLYSNTDSHRITSLRIDPEKAAIVRKNLKEAGYNLNDLIMAATMSTVYQWNREKGEDPETIRTRYAVNLRRWGKTDAHVANISCVQMHEAQPAWLTDAKTAIRLLKPQLDAAKATMGLDHLWKYRFMSLMPAFFFKRKGELFRKQYLNTVTKNHAVTFVGLIPESMADFGHASALSFSLFSPPIPRPNVLFLITTFKGDLTVNMGFSNLHMKRESAESLLNMWKEQFMSMG